MKKKILLCAALLGTSYFAVAQSGVGVGVALPHGSAMLDIEASDKGVSLPNVVLTSLSEKGPIAMEPKDGLLVYNTVADSTKDLIKGFYYWGDRDGAKGWLPIAANQSVVLTKDGDNYYFAQGDVTLNLSEEVNKTQKYALVIQQTAEENQNNVLLAKKFNDGKGDSADVLLTETLTSITKGKTAGTEQIIYTYTDETGKAASTELAITSDVIESFEEIIKDEKVKEQLNTFISKNTGAVSIVVDDNTGEITVHHKNGEVNDFFSLTGYIKDRQSYAGVSLVEKEKGVSGAGITVDTNSGAGDDTATFVETLTSTSRIDAKGEAADITAAPGKGLTYYEYKDESGDSRYLTVSQDVSNDFKKIVDNNKVFVEKIIGDIIANKPGNVEVISRGRDIIFIKHSNGPDREEVNLTEELKKVISVATLEDVYRGLDSKEVKLFQKFNSGVEGAKDVEVKETLTRLVRHKGRVEANLSKEDIPGGVNASTIETEVQYLYTDEAGVTRYFPVSQDIIDDFSRIVGKNKGFMKEFIQGVSGNAIVEGEYVEGENDPLDVWFLFEQSNGNNRGFSLSEWFEKHGGVSKLTVSGGGVEDGSLKVTFNSGFKNSPDIMFEESITSITRKTGAGGAHEVPQGYIYYDYFSEGGQENILNRINLTSDVISSFRKIMEAPSVVTQLTDFVEKNQRKDAVTMWRDEKDAVNFFYRDSRTNLQSDVINLVDYIKENQVYIYTDVALKEAVEGGNGVGITLNTNEEGVEEVEFLETRTLFNRYRGDDWLSNLEEGNRDVNGVLEGLDTETGFRYYTFTDESGAIRYLPVSQDISDDFEKIVEKNKAYLASFVKTAAGNVKVVKEGDDVVFVINEGETTEEKLNITQLVKDSSFVASISTQEATENTAGVGLALKFSDGKQVNPTELSFAETLTSFSKAKDANDFTEYTYSGEAGIDVVKLSVSQDVSDDFGKIVEKNREVIENIAKTVGANPWNVQGGDDTAVNNTDNIYAMGSVVIGSKTMLSNDKATKAKLSVEGDVVVNGKFFSANSVYADYVFENYFTGSSDYNLTYEFKSLDYVKDFVEKYNHLPGVTKISDVERTEDGKYLIDFSELSMQQLEKIEELYLHTIEQQEDINTLKRQLEALKSDVELLKASFQTFKNK